MKVNIYYGGRGVIGDPSLFAVKRMMKVFEEINVKVQKYDLYDANTNITTLPQTLKDCDGIVLASTVEWHGVGGYLMSFLDACWLYGDKEKISEIYMAPVVLSTTYGEKEASLDLKNAWEALGGKVCDGICGYTPNTEELEQNDKYVDLIEKSVENIYRSITKKIISLPSSSKVVSQQVNKTKAPLFTQQENEQLSEYISDDDYVKQQKADIKELAGFFKGKLGDNTKDNCDTFISAFKKEFKPVGGQHAKYKIKFSDITGIISIRVENSELIIDKTDLPYPDVEITVKTEVLNEIISGRKTFQGAFMEGSIINKGDFAILRMLDEIFPFMK